MVFWRSTEGKKIIVVLSIIITLMVLWMKGLASKQEVSITPTIDLGGVLQGSRNQAQFTIHNYSLREIRLVIKGKSCSCTTANLERDRLGAGESGLLTLLIDTGDRVGKFSSNVVLEYYDASHTRQLSASVQLNAQRLALINPPRLDMGIVDVDSAHIKFPIVVSKGESALAWYSIAAKSKCFGLLPVSNVSNKAVVNYEGDVGQSSLGRFRDMVTLQFFSSNSVLLRTVNVPVDAEIKSSLSCSPMSVFLSIIKPGAETTGTIKLQTPENIPIKFNALTTATLKLRYELDQPQSNMLIVKYFITLPETEQSINENLVLNIATNKIRRLTIPILGYVRF